MREIKDAMPKKHEPKRERIKDAMPKKHEPKKEKKDNLYFSKLQRIEA